MSDDDFRADDDLRDIFRSAPAPELRVDPDAVLAGGRGRVRRRRRAIGGALSGVAALGLVGALTISGLPRFSEAPTLSAADSSAGRADRSASEAAGASPRAATDPSAVPTPNGTCAARSASFAGDIPGAATPYDAARAEVPGDGRWYVLERTADRARLYRDGTWLSVMRGAKGWFVDSSTRCTGYTTPALPALVPETASADSAQMDAADGIYALHLSGDPLWPEVALRHVVSDVTATRTGRHDPAFTVRGTDVRAYRTSDATVLLSPLGTDEALSLVIAERSDGPGIGMRVEVGGVPYWAQLTAEDITPSDVRDVYRTAADGTIRSSTGETPVRASFDDAVTVTWFPTARYGVVSNSSTGASGHLGPAPSWNALNLGNDSRWWSVGILPAGARDPKVPFPATVRTKDVGPYVVVLVEQQLDGGATRQQGALTWTDAGGRSRTTPG